ncbi:bacillolysin [Bacillus mycoides]|nr:bacillolysin [Bacillus mycoides]
MVSTFVTFGLLCPLSTEAIHTSKLDENEVIITTRGKNVHFKNQ